MGLSAKVLFRLNVFFSPMRCDFLNTSAFFLSQVPLSALFFSMDILETRFLLFAFIPQPFFYICFFSFSFLSFLIWRVSFSLYFYGFARLFLHFLTSACPSYHTPNSGFWPMLAIHLYHISSGLYVMDTIRSWFHKFIPKKR